MTAPLDLEALKERYSRPGYAPPQAKHDVLALIARVEAAETEVKTLEMTLPGLRQLIVEGRAAGFREAVEAAAKVCESSAIYFQRPLSAYEGGFNAGATKQAAAIRDDIRALAPRDEVAG